jgi:hypothetical protein
MRIAIDGHERAEQRCALTAPPSSYGFMVNNAWSEHDHDQHWHRS